MVLYSYSSDRGRHTRLKWKNTAWLSFLYILALFSLETFFWGLGHPRELIAHFSQGNSGILGSALATVGFLQMIAGLILGVVVVGVAATRSRRAAEALVKVLPICGGLQIMFLISESNKRDIAGDSTANGALLILLMMYALCIYLASRFYSSSETRSFLKGPTDQ